MKTWYGKPPISSPPFLMGKEYIYKFWASESHIDFGQVPRMNYYRSTLNLSTLIASAQSYDLTPYKAERGRGGTNNKKPITKNWSDCEHGWDRFGFQIYNCMAMGRLFHFLAGRLPTSYTISHFPPLWNGGYNTIFLIELL